MAIGEAGTRGEGSDNVVIRLAAPRLLSVLGVAIVQLACQAPSSEAGETSVTLSGSAGLIVSVGSGILGEVSDIAVAESGLVLVADRLGNSVHVFDSVGGLVRTIGRAGAGPSEFNGLRALEIRADSVLVVDEGNARMQVITLDGSYVRSERLPPSPGGFWDIGPRGLIAVPTMGLDLALVKVFDGPTVLVSRLGTPVGTVSQRVSFLAMKRELVEGTIPSLFLNMVQPVFGSEGEVWLVEPARASVERFELTTGERLDSVGFSDPGFDHVREDFIAANASLPGYRIDSPSFLLGGRVVEGELWVLVARGSERPPKLVAVSGEGEVRPLPYDIPLGAILFAIDAVRNRIYVATELAELYRVEATGAAPN